MLIIGSILIVLGILQYLWLMKWLDKHMLLRPYIFLVPILGKLIRLIWILLFLIGAYLLWQVYPTLVIIFTLSFIFIIIYNFKVHSLNTKARNIIILYKRIKKINSQIDERATLEQTAREFLKKQGLNEKNISPIIKSIANGISAFTKIEDIKNLAIYLLYQIYPSNDITSEIEKKIEKAVLIALKLI